MVAHGDEWGFWVSFLVGLEAGDEICSTTFGAEIVGAELGFQVWDGGSFALPVC